MADALPDRLPPLGSPNVLFQSFRTNHALRELTAELFEGTGVTGDEYGVLGVIHFFPDTTPTKLAETLGLPPTTVSRHVNRFVEMGLAQRVPNPQDGRSYLLRPTRRGSAVVRRIAPRIGELVAELGPAADRPLEDIADALVALETAAKRVASKRRVATKR